MSRNKLYYTGIMTGYACTAACRHCMYCSSPSIPKAFMDEGAAGRIARALARGGVRSVHIGGGEPFLNFESLCVTVEALRRERVGVDYIETNASWCGEDALVRRRLERLRGLGANCVMASVDPFHIEFVPLERPLRLIRLLDEMGMDSFIWQERFLRRLLPLDHTRPHTHGQLKEVLGENYVEETAAEYGLGGSGRALTIARRIYRPRPAAALLSSKPCDLLDGGHCHVDLYENVVPGGCPGIAISLSDFLNRDVPEDKYPVAARLMSGGTRALYDYALGHGFAPDDDGYVTACELCYAMRAYLVSAAPSPDVGPECFYIAMGDAYAD